MTRDLETLQEIESAQHKDATTIWSLGGAGCAITSENEIIYIDPYLIVPREAKPFHRAIPVPFPPQKIRRATAVLSTHEHEDHCDEETIRAFQKNTNAVFIGPRSSTSKVLGWGYTAHRVVTVRSGDKHELSSGVTILVFDSNDPYAESPVTYLVKTPRGNIFHSGDTSYFSGFQEMGQHYSVEVALLNFGKQVPTPDKPYYMNAEGVARAARDLKARTVIPNHWDIWLEARDDPASIKGPLGTISPHSKLRILNLGERFEL